MTVHKGMIKGKCKACGWAGDLDNVHQLAAYVVKNPPDSTGCFLASADGTGAGKSAKELKREAKKKKEELGGVEAEEQEGQEDGSEILGTPKKTQKA